MALTLLVSVKQGTCQDGKMLLQKAVEALTLNRIAKVPTRFGYAKV